VERGKLSCSLSSLSILSSKSAQTYKITSSVVRKEQSKRSKTARLSSAPRDAQRLATTTGKTRRAKGKKELYATMDPPELAEQKVGVPSNACRSTGIGTADR